MNDNKLMPCVCGGKMGIEPHMFGDSAFCLDPKCGCETPNYPTESEAITAWNKMQASLQSNQPHSKQVIISALEEAQGYLDDDVHKQVSYDVYSGMFELLCNIHEAVDDAFSVVVEEWSSEVPKKEGYYWFYDLSQKDIVFCHVFYRNKDDTNPEVKFLDNEPSLAMDDIVDGLWLLAPSPIVYSPKLPKE